MDFHGQYVLVPADKAANNIIVVCKKYYLDVVVSELGLNMPNTYVETNTTCGALIARHLDDTLRWNIAIPI